MKMFCIYMERERERERERLPLLCRRRLFPRFAKSFFGSPFDSSGHIFASPLACVTTELVVFFVVIVTVSPHITAQTCCRPTKNLRELPVGHC